MEGEKRTDRPEETVAAKNRAYTQKPGKENLKGEMFIDSTEIKGKCIKE